MPSTGTRNRRLALGLCPDCGARPERARQRCAACLGKIADANAHRQARLLAAGLCITCGRESHEPGRKVCGTCRKRFAAYMRQRTSAR